MLESGCFPGQRDSGRGQTCGTHVKQKSYRNALGVIWVAVSTDGARCTCLEAESKALCIL